MSLHSDYHGHDDVRIGNGKTLPISHTGHSIFNSSTHSYFLKNILHVPDSCANLLSVTSFTTANNVSVEFFPTYFLIKDILTRQVLHTGPNDNGLYSMLFDSVSSPTRSPTAFVASSLSQWHNILGHANYGTINHILGRHRLPFHKNKLRSCNACNVAKSHKLPFSLSNFQAKEPLELICSDLWGPAPIESVDGCRYYVLFFDHYIKYSWIYFIKFKSEVLSVFIKFRHLVESFFNRSIKSFQQIGEANIKHYLNI